MIKQSMIIIMIANTFSFGGTILERKIILPSGKFNEYRLEHNIFLAKDGDASILIDDSQNLFLYQLNNLQKINIDWKNYIFRNGFMENDHLMLAFVNWPEEYRYSGINIYDFQKGFDKPVKYFKVPWRRQKTPVGLLITDPQTPDKYYVFCHLETFPGVERFTHYLCGGYAIGYAKPYLAEVNKGYLSAYDPIEYGGEEYESFSVSECISNGNKIYCIGRRHPKEHDGVLEPNSTVTLWYTVYDPTDKKAIQFGSIYQIKTGYDYDFGTSSLAVNDGNAFVIFYTYKYPERGILNKDFSKYVSDVFYCQFNQNSKINTTKIAQGFLPLVRLDAARNVYAFYLDYKGNIAYKMKTEKGWSDEKIIINNLIIPKRLEKECFSIEFDKLNNLHCVYRTDEGIVYTKMKLN